MRDWLNYLGYTWTRPGTTVDPETSTGRQNNLLDYLYTPYYGYDYLVRETSRFIGQRTGLYPDPLVLKTVHVSLLGAGLYWMFNRHRSEEYQETEPNESLSLRLALPEYPQTELYRSDGGGFFDYSRITTTSVPLIVRYLDIEPEQVYCNPSFHLTQSYRQVLWMSQCKKNKEISLLGMKTLFRTDLEKIFFPEMRHYRVYHSRYTDEEVGYLITHDTLRNVYTVPRDITSLISRYLTRPDFEELGPNVRIFSLPPIGDWHWRELETYRMTTELLNKPEWREVAGRLDLEARRKIFDILLQHRDDMITEVPLNTYGLGAEMSPSRDLGWVLFRILTSKATDEEMTRIEDYLSRPVLIDKSKIERHGFKKWFADLRNLSSDKGISEYLDRQTREALDLEMTVFGFLLDEIVQVRLRNKRHNLYDNHPIELVFSKFSKDTTAVLTSQSDYSGFVYRKTTDAPWISDTVHKWGLKDYFRKKYQNHPVNTQKESVYGKLNNGSRSDFWTDDRLSFDMDVVLPAHMFKTRAFESLEPANIEGVVGLVVTGVRVFNWLNRFDVSSMNSLWTARLSAYLNVDYLYETVSPVALPNQRYLGIEQNIYLEDIRREYLPLLNKPQINHYLNSCFSILGIPHDRWNVFCLRNMDVETACAVARNVKSPNPSTFMIANRDFVTFYDEEDRALNTYGPDALTSSLLKHWADHALCNFAWNVSHTHKIKSKLRVENPFYWSLHSTFPDSTIFEGIDTRDMSQDLRLYMKLYAATTMRANLLDQIIQLKVSSGVSTSELGGLNRFIEEGRNEYSNHYRSVVRRREFVLENGSEYLDADQEREISDYVEKLLVNQAQVVQKYGVAPFTDWPGRFHVKGDTHYPLTKDQELKAHESTARLVDYHLPANTQCTENLDYEVDSSNQDWVWDA